MKIAIVEDEAVVARRLERMVRTIVGTPESIEVAPSLPAALELIHRPLDLLFLDLNLRGRDGFSLLEEAAASPFQTVVVSAHHEQAVRAFEYGVTDFVVKPWTEERLRLAIDRVNGRGASPRQGMTTLVVRKGRELRSIPAGQIAFIRGADDYSELHLADGTVHLHGKSLTALEAVLPGDFARVHRSYIANLTHARGLRASALVLGDATLVPVGRLYRAAVRERVLHRRTS